jgi:hypothetical protein
MHACRLACVTETNVHEVVYVHENVCLCVCVCVCVCVGGGSRVGCDINLLHRCYLQENPVERIFCGGPPCPQTFGNSVVNSSSKLVRVAYRSVL